jgi:hypothetical protein
MDIVGVSAARNLIGFSFAAASSTTYTVSFYVESVSGVTGIVAYATGALGTGGTSNTVVAPTTTGRYTYTFTTGTSAGTVDLRFGIGAAANESGSIRISNVQCEAGAFATSYIPTVASQVTRAADVCSIVAPMFAPWYNQSEGTFVVQADSVVPTVAASYATMSANDNSGSNRHNMLVFSGQWGAVTSVGGVDQTNIFVAGSYTTNAVAKMGYAYAANNFAFSVNGSTPSTDTSGTVPTVDRFFVGSSVTGGGVINGHIRSVQYYPVRLADFQLQALTA